MSVVILAAAEGEPCVPADIPCWLGAGAADAISKATNEGLQEFVNNILEAFGKAVASLGTMWINIPSPVTIRDGGGGVSGNVTPPESQAFEEILGYVTWVSAGIAILSLIFAGVMMASRRRHGDGEAHMGRVGIILFSVILLSAASALVAGFLPQAFRSNQASSVVGFMQNQLYWYTGGLAILSVIIAAARMAITQRAQPAKELLQSLLTLIAVSGAGLVGIVLATQAADAFSVWILNNSMDCDVAGDGQCFGRNIFFIMQLTAESGIGLFALFILGILAFLMTVVQIILMVVRGAMLVVLAGILPLTASFTNTEMGRMWFKRALGWTIAFILYKPAAAIVYATAFRLVGADAFKADGSGFVQVLCGMALMLIALIALPALMKFVAPAVSAMSGGGGGGAGLALAAAGGAAIGDIASGATRSRGNGGGGGGGGGQSDGPTGSKSSSGGGTGAALGGASKGATGAASSGAAAGATAGAAAGPAGMAAGAVAAKTAGHAAQAAGAVKQAASGAVSREES
jgi:hypothetical protein